MARLKRDDVTGLVSSDDSDFAETQSKQSKGASNGLESLSTQRRSSPRKKTQKSASVGVVGPNLDDEPEEALLRPKTTPNAIMSGRQIRLAPLSTLAMSKPLQCQSKLVVDLEIKKARARSPLKQSSRPSLVPQNDCEIQPADNSSECTTEVEVEESIWCHSDASSDDSEDELPSPRKFLRFPQKPKPAKHSPDFNDAALHDQHHGLESESVRNPKSKVSTVEEYKPLSRPASSSDKENLEAFLSFSPPRLHSPSKSRQTGRPVTPPQSPSKPRLQSPSKTKIRIPTPPLRQSLDAFWNPDTVNAWNEQYSPRKILKSPIKLKFLQDESSQSPTSSPRKPHSPTKRSKAGLDAKKDFEAKKHKAAESFLDELDDAVTQGKIRELVASTGGVRLIWSRTLNSTAGRANWRKETTKTRMLDGTTETFHKHHASIELAEKVIDDENRLLNVIAHEFCHLANFMVSGIKNQPHGKQFKVWGLKCTRTFGERGVQVTTKHSYQIEYKYIWQCCNEDCGVEFKRHSKSVDPKKHTCGSCRSKLVQIKPVPRKDAGNGATGYAAYVKAHFAEVKRSMPGGSQKQLMEAVACKYRAEKHAKSRDGSTAVGHFVDDPSTKTKDDIDEIGLGLEVITLSD